MRTTTSLSDVTRILAVSFLVVAAAGSSDAGDLETDGAFVTTKISGPPLAVSGTDVAPGLNADTLDGLEGSSLPRSPANIVTVGKSGADFTSVKAAVDSITDASETNPYLVRIGPGTYEEDCGEIDLPGHIHLEGGGADTTFVDVLFNDTCPDPGLNVLGPTSLTSFKLRADENQALQLDDPNSPASNPFPVSIHDVVIDLFQLSNAGGGVVGLIVFPDAVAQVTKSKINVFGRNGAAGLVTHATSTLLRDVTIVVDDNSSVGSSTDDASGIQTTGSLDAERITVRVSGAQDSRTGIDVDDSAGRTRMVDSQIEVSHNAADGTGPTIGANVEGSDVEFRGISIVANGDSEGIRISNSSSADLMVANSRIEVTGSAIGIRTLTGTASVYHSEIETVSTTVSADSGATANVVHSHLAGTGVTGIGTINCRWITDANFGNFSTSCP